MLLTSISLFILAYILSGMIELETYVLLDIIDSIITPFLIPLMYVYFKSLTDKTLRWEIYLLLFTPPIIVSAGTIMSYLFIGWDDAMTYTFYIFNHQQLPAEYNRTLFNIHYFFSINLYTWVTFFQTILVSIYAIYNMMRYHARLRDFYSNLSDKSIDIDNKLLLFLLLDALFSVVLAITREYFWMDYHSLTMLYFVSWAAIYFGLCFYGAKTRHSVNRFADDLKQADLNEEKFYDTTKNRENYNNIINDDKYRELMSTFERLIHDDKIFLKSDLRLDEVAGMMRTNRSYVSLFIKSEYNCSFSDYINEKRIEFSKELMISNPQLKQDEVGNQSGFINAQSFSRVFKQMTGLPPKEWCYKSKINS